ncbi:MAG: diguanylate cyclase domain-containing protein [Planctomycetota bacterium]|nr:diguanylate cyclase [Planctomycetota bacterium]
MIPERDHVTGLAPRRHLEDLLEAPWRDPAALLIADVVALKQVNETAGFRAGDDRLRHAADRLRTAAPSATITARLGGDEMVALFTGATALADAESAATRLRSAGEPALRAAAAAVVPGADPWAVLERLYASLRRS